MHRTLTRDPAPFHVATAYSIGDLLANRVTQHESIRDALGGNRAGLPSDQETCLNNNLDRHRFVGTTVVGFRESSLGEH